MSSAGEGETFMSQISLQADETYMDERLDKIFKCHASRPVPFLSSEDH